MKNFHKFFTLLFIISIFVGVLHELDSNHVHDETCEIYFLAHTPALLNDNIIITHINTDYEPFCTSFIKLSYQSKISLKSRSPPIL